MNVQDQEGGYNRLCRGAEMCARGGSVLHEAFKSVAGKSLSEAIMSASLFLYDSTRFQGYQDMCDFVGENFDVPIGDEGFMDELWTRSELPFQTIAFSCYNACILLAPCIKADNRKTMVAVSCRAASDGGGIMSLGAVGYDPELILSGKAYEQLVSFSFSARGEARGGTIGGKPVDTDSMARASSELILCHSLASCWAVNSTKHFVVRRERASLKAKARSGKKIPRFHDRPHYIFLDAKTIASEAGLTGEEKATSTTRTAGPRRGHWRHYRADRYKTMKGKRQWIKSTWVGSTEAVVDKTRWVVLPNAANPKGD